MGKTEVLLKIVLPVRFPLSPRPTPVMNEHFDVIIIGTGAGGGTLLYRLAASPAWTGRILVLERGPFLPREKDNWNYHGSFKYYSSEVMFNKDGGEIRPGFSYYVGGNTKVYGAALFRLREKDFEKFRHRDGISPEWPIKYRDWENYYTQAEELYEVHGKAGEDPTEPRRAKDYPFPPVSHASCDQPANADSKRSRRNFGAPVCQGEPDCRRHPTASAPSPRFQTAVVRFDPENFFCDGAGLPELIAV